MLLVKVSGLNGPILPTADQCVLLHAILGKNLDRISSIQDTDTFKIHVP